MPNAIWLKQGASQFFPSFLTAICSIKRTALFEWSLKTVILKHMAKAKWFENRLKAERARFFDRRSRRAKPETEPLLLICGLPQISGGAEGVCLLGRRAQAREGEAGSPDGIGATIGRGKAKLFPLRGVAGAKAACFRTT